MKRLLYSDIRVQLKMGDLVAFSGEGYVSKAIQFATHSDISHVGVVLDSNIGGQSLIQIMESTSLGYGFSGVRISRLSDLIKEYPGKVYIYQLKNEVYQSLNYYDFAYYLLLMKGRPYDVPQAILSALDGIIPDAKENFEKLFCSELVYEAYERGGIVQPGNASEKTPGDITELPIFDERILIEADCW